MNINTRSIILISIAVLIAGVTAMLARNLVAPLPEPGEQQVVVKVVDSKMKILVAATDMPVGHFVKREDMVWQSWPDETVHERYIQQNSDITVESLIGAVSVHPVSSGEPILNTRLVKPGNRGFMAAVLPTGMRAISVRITATTGNAGFVFPGDRVDILLTHQVDIDSEAREKARVSETVLRNVRVLAINQSTDNPTHTPSIGKTATLEVTSGDAEKISLIKNMGELTLVLRSLAGVEGENTQQTVADTPTATWDSDVSKQLSGSSGAQGKNHTVKVFRGGLEKNNSDKIDFNKTLSPEGNNVGGENTEGTDQ